ncbi:MAG: hypothetical protein V1750_05460, partial [Acidobacteriota bacterium]
NINHIAARHQITDHAGWLAISATISATTVAFSRPVQALFGELKGFIYRFIINHQEVNRQDHRARRVIAGLFRAYYENPLLLPTYALLRFHEISGRPYLRDVLISQIPAEVAQHYHSDARFVRLIADHLAGMSDRFALEEFASLYHPGDALASAARKGT